VASAGLADGGCTQHQRI